MISDITIKLDDEPIYDIRFSDSFDNFTSVIKDLSLNDRRICVITDTNVEQFHLSNLMNTLNACCSRVYSYVFPAGESNKNTKTIEGMYSFLIERHFDRNDVVCALGGGVVGDMTGFLAATYLRGIKFIQIPTSLLAMVDSSIGGKTGVDFNGYKNMVGAFHMPSRVYINTSVLATLPKREYISGYAEIIKHGLIKDSEYYLFLKNNSKAAMNMDMEVVSKIIYRSLQIKQSVVEEDPTEKGIRAYLNFGHTIGHAIEKYMNFTMLHGECVSLGIVAAMYICFKRDLISYDDYLDAKDVLSAYNLPVSIKHADTIDVDTIAAITKNDKKADNNTIKFVLLNRIGNAFIDKTVSDLEIKEAIRALL